MTTVHFFDSTAASQRAQASNDSKSRRAAGIVLLSFMARHSRWQRGFSIGFEIGAQERHHNTSNPLRKANQYSNLYHKISSVSAMLSKRLSICLGVDKQQRAGGLPHLSDSSSYLPDILEGDEKKTSLPALVSSSCCRSLSLLLPQNRRSERL